VGQVKEKRRKEKKSKKRKEKKEIYCRGKVALEPQSGVASNLAEMHCEICISQGPELDIFLMLVMVLMMSLLSCNTTLHTSLHCGL